MGLLYNQTAYICIYMGTHCSVLVMSLLTESTKQNIFKNYFKNNFPINLKQLPINTFSITTDYFTGRENISHYTLTRFVHFFE